MQNAQSGENLTTYTINCSGVPVCGIASNPPPTDSTTTVIVFEYPTSNTTSYYTMTLDHSTITAPPSTHTASNNESKLYLLTFNQTSICSSNTALYSAYFIPWSVTLKGTDYSYNSTIVQPPDAAPPTWNSSMSGSPADKLYSLISFTVPNGTYNFIVNPPQFNLLTSNSGTVTISGQNATVLVAYYPMSCGYLTTRTTSTTSPSG